jgi:hypothetical protein
MGLTANAPEDAGTARRLRQAHAASMKKPKIAA